MIARQHIDNRFATVAPDQIAEMPTGAEMLIQALVAEGVETVEQDQFLREHACDEIQGFLCSKAIAADKIADLLRLPGVAAPALQPGSDLAVTESTVRGAVVNTDVPARSREAGAETRTSRCDF